MGKKLTTMLSEEEFLNLPKSKAAQLVANYLVNEPSGIKHSLTQRPITTIAICGTHAVELGKEIQKIKNLRPVSYSNSTYNCGKACIYKIAANSNDILYYAKRANIIQQSS